jgi:F-type H+-transporting ATPase subunit b
MKTRTLLAALALVFFGLFVSTGVAGAQEPNTGDSGEVGDEEVGEEAGEEGGSSEEGEHDVSHAAEECIHELEEGGEPEDCHDAPSPILPATNELIWGGITFVVLLIGVAKFGLPAIKNMMDERTERIRGQIAEADAVKGEADRIRQEYSAQLADAKSEAARIIEEARQAADSVRRDLTQRAEAEAAELRQRNAEQLEAERNRLLSEMQGAVATLAIELAEKVVEANLDKDANNRLIESYISQVGQR